MMMSTNQVGQGMVVVVVLIVVDVIGGGVEERNARSQRVAAHQMVVGVVVM